MKIDFNNGKITLVIVPFDLRYGFYRLAQISAELLHIDINKCQDYVVFISKQRSIAKIIKYEISYLMILQIVLLRLKGTSVISFVGSQFIPNSLVEGFHEFVHPPMAVFWR